MRAMGSGPAARARGVPEAPSPPKATAWGAEAPVALRHVASTRPAPSERGGDIGNEYDLPQDILGEGGIGIVTRGVCRATGERVAVKRIELHRMRRPDRLESELSIAGEMRHPNIARLYEVYRDSDNAHMVMELCSGGELFERIATGNGLEEHVVAAYSEQMLSALGHLHARCVVHRDLKPENLLLESRRPGARLKLVDFGLSRRFEQGQLLTTKVGTPYYIAPEVLYQQYDELVDVWSAGIVAYACICGRPPFLGDTDQAVLTRVRRGAADFCTPRWQEVSPEAVAFVGSLLTVDPDHRPGAWEAMGHTWVSRCRQDDAAAEELAERHRRAFLTRPPAQRLAMAAAAWRLPDEQMGPSLAGSFGRGPGGGGAAPELLDYSAWLAASVDPKLCAQPSVAWAAFRALDADGDGMISGADLARFSSPQDEGHAGGAPVFGLDDVLHYHDFLALLDAADSEASASGAEPSDSEVDDRRHAAGGPCGLGEAAFVGSRSHESLSTAPSITG